MSMFTSVSDSIMVEFFDFLSSLVLLAVLLAVLLLKLALSDIMKTVKIV